jgi:RNA polymerase sigma-70 factor (ECF subfamily)
MASSDKPNPTQNEQSQTLARLWVRAQPSVSAYIWSSVRDFHIAEDLLQDVAEDAASSFSKYDPAKPFIAWVLGIARFKVVDYYRSKDRDPHIFDAEAMEHLSAAFEEVFPEVSPRQEALEHCMEKLPPKSRRLLEMRYEMEMKPAKIADQVGTTSGSIRVLLTRVRNALGDCVEKRLKQLEGDHA